MAILIKGQVKNPTHFAFLFHFLKKNFVCLIYSFSANGAREEKPWGKKSFPLRTELGGRGGSGGRGRGGRGKRRDGTAKWEKADISSLFSKMGEWTRMPHECSTLYSHYIQTRGRKLKWKMGKIEIICVLRFWKFCPVDYSQRFFVFQKSVLKCTQWWQFNAMQCNAM